MKLTSSHINLMGAGLKNNNPLPYLRAIKQNQQLEDAGLLPRELKGLGIQTGYRVLPCTIQDNYDRVKKPIELKTVVMENDCLKATFLCEYGGRLYSLFDKRRKKELLYVNPVFQPCNLSVRNAWFSGGVEWNVGQYGHTSLTCEPVHFAKCADGEYEFLRMFTYERIKGYLLQIDFHLPDSSEHLFAHIRQINTHDEPNSIYYWSNTAVSQSKNVRVLSGTKEVIATKFVQGTGNTFMHDALPELDMLAGLDASYPLNFPFSAEYFFQNEASYDQSWEAAVYDDGTAFYERSTPNMPHRKMFCWGNTNGGKHWQEFLSIEGGEDYIEIQSGILPTQVHGKDVEAKYCMSVTQAFGGTDIKPQQTHQQDWDAASKYMYKLIEEQLPANRLSELHAQFEGLSSLPIGEILHEGEAWGALEQMRDVSIFPPSVCFDIEAINDEQKPWAELLKNGKMPPFKNGLPSSFMVDTRWQRMLEKAIERDENPQTLFHYALMLYENGQRDKGMNLMASAAKEGELPIAYRTLAMMHKQNRRFDEAILLMENALEKGALEQSGYFAQDYIDLLIEAREYKKAWNFYCSLDDNIKAIERLRINISAAAFEMEEWEFLENQFHTEFAAMREGEVGLTDIWFKTQAIKFAKEKNIEWEKALEIAESMNPPHEIDFRVNFSLKG